MEVEQKPKAVMGCLWAD